MTARWCGRRLLHNDTPSFRAVGDSLSELPALPEVGDGFVRLRMLAAPLNPADINMIEGSYAVLPPLPAVVGNEGVAVVEEVGPGVRDVAVGNWVVPRKAGLGTWRSGVVCRADETVQVPKDLPLELAAMMMVNPCTAYRMLKDFVPLSPGDTVIQNGATSAVGNFVVQLARSMGVRTVNVVRDRSGPELDECRAWLSDLGADVVLTESEVERGAARDLFAHQGGSGFRTPRLALNCAGGKSATELARVLGHGGQLVTYGNMSKKPVALPAGLLIFKDLSFRGFWMSRWYDQHGQSAERDRMMRDLENAARANTLRPPRVHWVDLDGPEALQRAFTTRGKVVVRFPP